MVGLIVIAAFILLALFAPLIAPYDPIATNWTLVRKPPSARIGSAPTISAATYWRA